MYRNKSIVKSSFDKNPESFWISSVTRREYPPLNQKITADAVIVGGGIVGITTAVLLHEAGMKAVLLEGGRILGGTTAHTTAKVTSQHRLIYDYLKFEFGDEMARQYADANQAAVEMIAQRVEKGNIDCDFSRRSSYVYTESEAFIESIEKEVRAAQSLGIQASYVTETDLPFPVRCAVRFDNQAMFHPLKYLLGLLEPAVRSGLEIYEHTRALDIKGELPYTVVADKGEVTAPTVVIASHYPFYDKPGMYFARMYQSRSYILAFKAKGTPPDGMYISADDPVHSFRTLPSVDGSLVLVAGEGHRTGHGDNTEMNYERLREYAERVYGIQSVEHRWSAQDCITADSIPYIGRLSPGKKNIYVGTGFGKWGMSNGTAAAVIISDMIKEKKNLWAEVFNPARFDASASVGEIAKHTITTVKDFVGDKVQKVLSADDKDEKTKPGPMCTHLGCQTTWNKAEQTWDCPCHGSRFSKDGKVIESPAVKEINIK